MPIPSSQGSTDPSAFAEAQHGRELAQAQERSGLIWPRALTWFEAASGWPLAGLLALLFLLNVAVSFPGTMMNDSVNQYAEAVSGRFTDWHPPVMAWLWSHLRNLHEGPAPLFLLHLAAYWGGIALLADAVRRDGHRRTAVFVALSGAFPPFIFMNANVIKDVGMAVALLAGVALVYWHRVQGKRLPIAWAVLAAALLLYGMLVRTNAVFAFAPLLVFVLAPTRWLRGTRLVVASLAIAVLAVPVSNQINKLAFQPQQREAVASLLLYDIAGVAAHQRDPSLLLPRAEMGADDLARCYTPFWWDSFSPWGACRALVKRPDNDRATHSQGLAKQWLATVQDNPVAYLAHRLKHFNSEVMFAVPLKHLRLTPEYRGDTPGFQPLETFSEGNVRMDLVRKNPVVWPVTWLVWGGVLFLFLVRARPSSGVLLARTLLLSAIAYTGAYFFIGVATDIRYHYWSMLATLLATLLAMPQVVKGWRDGSGILHGGLSLVGLVVALGLAARLLDFQAWVL